MQPTVFDEGFGKTNDFLYLSNGKIKYIKYLYITKLRYSEQSLQVPWLLVISRFYCNWTVRAIARAP